MSLRLSAAATAAAVALKIHLFDKAAEQLSGYLWKLLLGPLTVDL